MRIFTILFLAVSLLAGCRHPSFDRVGTLSAGGRLTATFQYLHPAGQSVEFGGRPVDLVAAPDGRTIYVKDNRGLVVIDSATWRVACMSQIDFVVRALVPLAAGKTWS